MEVQQGVTRPAAAAMQPGAEMNETYGMSTSKGISQDNLVLNFYPDLSRVMQVWLLYPNVQLTLNSCKAVQCQLRLLLSVNKYQLISTQLQVGCLFQVTEVTFSNDSSRLF